MTKFFLLLALSTILASCNVNSSDITIIPIDNFYESPEENEQLAKDLMTYNYGQLIGVKNLLELEEMKLLNNVRLEYFIQSESKLVDFRLIFKNEARPIKEKITPFFEEFIQNKVLEYKEKSENIEIAISKASEFSELIENNELDSIWNRTTPRLQVLVTKEKFSEEIRRKNEKVGSCGLKTINSRQLYKEINTGMEGEFYVIIFECEKGIIEHYTMELLNNQMKLMGFRWYYPNS